MTKQTGSQGLTAAEAGRAFYADPSNRIAAERMRYVDGVPDNATITDLGQVHSRQVAQQAQARLTRRPSAEAFTGSRQYRAAVTHRTVRPLPTRAARKARRVERRALRRLGLAAPAAFLALAALIFFIPAIAAVTVALVIGALVLAHTK